MLEWTRELLFTSSTRELGASTVQSDALSADRPVRLSARLTGERFDAGRHRVKLEIDPRARAYREYRLERTDDG